METAESSSRIFVRNLPPTLKEAEFQRHFAQAGPVTDAKFIPHRRIGYVGYKTPSDAQNAVRHFNRTFVRMSKIAVELARSVKDLEDERKQRRDERYGPKVEVDQEEHQKPPKKRRKLEGEEVGDTAKDPKQTGDKLNEFLDTMQPGSRSKLWANEDHAAAAAGVAIVSDSIDPPVIEAEEAESEVEYETVPKRRKPTAKSSEDQPTPHSKHLPQDNNEQHADPGSAAGAGNGMQDVDDEEAGNGLPRSDADWLRSRTSRLLGLDAAEDSDEASNDDEDVDTRRPRLVKGEPSQRDSGTHANNSSPQEDQAMADASSQTDDDLHETPQAKQKPDGPSAASTARLFVRNLSYQTTEEELWEHFSSFGTLEEVHIPRDGRRAYSKGFAYVQFKEGEAAERAAASADGTPFQGRLLHILSAAAKRENTLDEYAISKLPHKKQQQIRKKAEAASSTFQWNTLFMNPDAVLASMAEKLGVSKSEILDPTSSGAAVKQAHAETNVLQDTKRFFEANGVEIESFRQKGFSDTVILIKNFPFGTSTDELRRLFEAHGTIKRMLMPPAGTMAIVEFEHPIHAKRAFGAMAYSKIGDSVLFLEKAPKQIFSGKVRTLQGDDSGGPSDSLISTTDLLDPSMQEAPSATLFVRNLNFDTTTANLHDLFLPLKGFLSARVKTKTDPKKPGQLLSMGYGFVEFRSKEDGHAALNALNGYALDGHKLQIRASHKALDAAEERRREDDAKKAAGRHTKIIIKNLPFEATKKDVRELFSPYGKLRSVRVPKKFDSSTRGFAFGDFVTPKEAQNAMSALAGAHLLGRRLNLEFAAADAVNPEEEIEKMEKKVSRQADRVAAQQLAQSGQRKKFNLNQEEDDLDA